MPYRSFVLSLCAGLWCLASASAETPLTVTIKPGKPGGRDQSAPDFASSYVPLSDGGVIDFAGWMKQKYGLSGWRSDAALLDQATGRTALIVYGLEKAAPQGFEEDAYSFAPQLPGCGMLTKLLFGQSKCMPDWQLSASDRVGTGVLAPQMVGLADFNYHTALSPGDVELGRIRSGPPPTSLSLVP